MSGAVASPVSLGWFTRHELRLAWRDWVQLMSGGRRLRDRAILIGMALFALALHGIAYAVLAPFFAGGAVLGPGALVMITASLLLSFTMMLSQAMESVTRAFYARDDLDLILSSPASSRDLFLVRIGLMAVTTAMVSALMVAPFIHVAAWLGGPAWLAGYGVVLGTALLATGAAVLITLALFRSLGAGRTRLVAQVAAAIVGAAFLIGLQVVGIISYGSMSRVALLSSEMVVGNAPGAESLLWLPARAVTGEAGPLAGFLLVALAFFVLAARTGAVEFRETVVAALGVSQETRGQKGRRRAFGARSPQAALMRKELLLIARDPWLISQTLMQVLYLVPPALMLWISFGEEAQVSVIVAPVIVMAVGQLAGGLAWLAISGEDAPDLIATAPVGPLARLAAKVNAVLAIVACVVAPVVLGLLLVSVWSAAVTFAGALLAAACAILIQLWFRAQAKRSNFRRRQVASKASTFSEALASILCAGATALAVAGTVLAIIPAGLLVLVMAVAWTLSPRRDA